MAKKDTFCILPWIHLYANTEGFVGPCCIAYPEHYTKTCGNLSTQTVKEAMNSPFMNQLRKKMMNGEKDPACNVCYNIEELGYRSYRQEKNETFKLKDVKLYGEYPVLNTLIENTNKKTGELKKFDLKYLDVRFSNLCNFKCIMCSHRFSSAWYEDAKKLEPHVGDGWSLIENNKNKKVLEIGGGDELWDKLEPYLKDIEFIYFAGGEPLVTEYHYKILEKLIEIKNFPQLHYNTNFSKLKYKQYDLLEMWQNFPSISLSVSLDDSGERGEYIRKGMDWEVILKNRKIIRNVCPDVHFSVHTVLQITNSLNFTNFFTKLLRTQFVDKPTKISIDYLHWPTFQSITVLPKQVKDIVKEKIGIFKGWFIKRYPNDRDHEHLLIELDKLVDYMYSKDHAKELPIYFKNMNLLDKIRDQNLLETFPELKILMEE
jgi:organic radical activating enzyme